MQRLRHHFLARPVFAGDQHIRIGGSDARDRLEHRLHGRRGRDELGAALRAQQPVLRLQALRRLQRPMELDLGPQDHREQPLVLPWLLDEIPRPAAHRLDRQLDVAPRRHHDHGKMCYR